MEDNFKFHPFAIVKPRRTLFYYLHWTISLLLCPILIPLKIILALLCIVTMKFIVQQLTKNINIDRPMHKGRYTVIRGVVSFFSRLLLFAFGVVRIKEVNKQLKPDPNTSHIVIQNHVSSVDPVALISLGMSSFVAKEEIKKMPGFGIAAWALQGIFIDRNDKDSSAKVVQKIIDRVANDIHELGFPRKYPVITICPEATTTNQTCILPFKKGAFNAGKPVSMVLLKYDNRFLDRSDAGQGMIKTQFASMISLYQVLTIEYLGDYVPNEDEIQDSQLYADNVREFYHKYTGWPKVDYNFVDKYYFQGRHNDYDKCSAQYKKDFGKEIRTWNYKMDINKYNKQIKLLKQKQE